MWINWLGLALRDIDEIAEYISKTNPGAAKEIVEIIWHKSKALIEHPNIGRPGRVSGTRELYITGTKYIIPYRVVGEQIQILRVLHTSRLL